MAALSRRAARAFSASAARIASPLAHRDVLGVANQLAGPVSPPADPANGLGSGPSTKRGVRRETYGPAYGLGPGLCPSTPLSGALLTGRSSDREAGIGKNPTWQLTAQSGFASNAAKKKQDTSRAKTGEGSERNTTEILLNACLKGEPVAQIERDEAELAADMAQAKEYSRLMLAAHRQHQAQLSARLKAKLAAIEAIPAGKLRDAALVPDYTPFPKKMMAPSLTPPLETEAEELLAARSKPVRKIR